MLESYGSDDENLPSFVQITESRALPGPGRRNTSNFRQHRKELQVVRSSFIIQHMPDSPESSAAFFDEPKNRRRIEALRSSGVVVWSADRVFVGPEVPLERIEPQAELMNAVIRGERSAIGAGAKLGTSGPAVLDNTQVGRRVEMGAGSYRETTLLEGVKVRGFAELRQGTVLEECAELGHNVGLKHTFFSAGTVAGSLINYCDVLVTGGSSRQDHTEIGSGAIHFNFDPRGDKFGSLIGDARGVLLRQRRIFIGGNTGLVAPVQIGFGAVIPAGGTVRRNVAPDCIYQDTQQTHPESTDKSFDPDVYYDMSRKLLETAALCGNLSAVEVWYQAIRLPFCDEFEALLCRGVLNNIRLHLEHRALELDKVIGKLARLVESADGGRTPFRSQHRSIVQLRGHIFTLLTKRSVAEAPTDFLEAFRLARRRTDHGTAIRELPTTIASLAEDWMARIAAEPGNQLRAIFNESFFAKSPK